LDSKLVEFFSILSTVEPINLDVGLLIIREKKTSLISKCLTFAFLNKDLTFVLYVLYGAV